MSGPVSGPVGVVVAAAPVAGSEAVALRRAYAEHLRDVFGSATAVDPDDLPPDADLAPPGGAFWLARRGGPGPGAALGCVGARALPGGDVEVKRLFVEAAGRGSGAGRALLGAVEAWAADRGAARVVLDTAAALVPAARLYRACGYTEVARYNDNPHAELWFAKALRLAGGRPAPASG